MSNKYIGHKAGLIGPVSENVIESKPDFRDYDQGGQYHNAYVTWFNKHLATLSIIPCEGWKPEDGREYTEGVHFTKQHQYYNGDAWRNCGLEFFISFNLHKNSSFGRIVAVPLTPAPDYELNPKEGAAYLTLAPTEQAEGGEKIITVDDIDPRVIYNYLIGKGEAEYAEHFNVICDKAYHPPVREGYPAEPPSDFTLWVVVNKWQYDHVQHKWYNTFVRQMQGKSFTHTELFKYWNGNIQSQSK